MDNELGPLKKNEIQLTRLPRLSGKRYLTYGAFLMVLKYTVDTLFCALVFHHPWSISEYFVPGALTNAHLLAGGTATGGFYGAMLMIALPFAFIGAYLTLRRLKAIGLPPWLVILFFTPFINMIFFVVLSVVEGAPSKETLPDAIANKDAYRSDREQLKLLETNQGKVAALDGWANKDNPGFVTREIALAKAKPQEQKFLALMDKLPLNGKKAFFAAAVLPVPIAVLAALFSVSMLGTYGWTVFTAIPFIASIASPILYGWRKQRTMFQCIGVSVVSLMCMASVLLIIPFEGIICVMMAAPLALGVGVVGGTVGYMIQTSLPRTESMPRLMGCFAIALPLLIIGEYVTPPDVPLYENVSRIQIAAPPAVVWKYLIDFPPMGEPADLVFKTGIAYPIRAKITGHGQGAIRRCIFTTGEFIEPINIWDAPHLLRFGVLAQAPPMHELSLYPNLHPAHLDNYLVARQGQFLLNDTKNGGTELAGTTWYQNYMGPSPYWRLWSDWIIHRIHMRVLEHVKSLAENEVRATTTENKTVPKLGVCK